MEFEPSSTLGRGVAPLPSSRALTARISGVTKSFGPTRAVDGLGFELSSREITALIGGNGAGKSTLMKVLAGEVQPDSGSLHIGDRNVPFPGYTPAIAHSLGVRIVHQELSLLDSLTVAENFYIEQGHREPGHRWRRRYAVVARTALDDAFGGSHRVSVEATVSKLDAGQRQMVEIARAASSPHLRLLILDEPTSSLGVEHIPALGNLLRRLQDRGVIIVFITHKMNELTQLTDRILVMREGRLAGERRVGSDTSVTDLLNLMTGTVPGTYDRLAGDRSRNEAGTDVAAPVLRIRQSQDSAVRDVVVRPGEVVGLVGLQGAGQEETLRAAQLDAPHVSKTCRSAYVTGDRKAEGIFPLWSTDTNLVATALAAPAFKTFWKRAVGSLTAHWYKQLGLSPSVGSTRITTLSGGMQQKALFARGLATDAPLLLLNDPTRGVDLSTKREMYTLIHTLAGQGRAVLWYTSEDSELAELDRAYVFSEGTIVDEALPPNLNASRIVSAALQASQTVPTIGAASSPAHVWRDRLQQLLHHRWIFAFIGLIAVLAVLQGAQQVITNPVGLGLVLSTAPVLALSAISQMILISIGDIDLGIGPFMSLTVAISATALTKSPLVGVAFLILATLIYPALAWFISRRKIPAIIATLAMSFVYTGLALVFLPEVGGTVPPLLTSLVSFNIPLVPVPLLVLVVVGVLAWWLLERTRLGVQFRAHGANPGALILAGRSVVKIRMIAYIIAGGVAVIGGLYFAGIATSGDPNATDGYTLLTIAAIVVGGCAFLGGRVSPIGVVLAAALLSLIGVLLGILQVPSLFTAAATGLILIVVMALRAVFQREELD